MIQVLGFIAGIFTSVAFIPQVYKAYSSKKVNDLAWGLAVMYWVGIFLWLLYGMLLKDVTLVFANSVSLILSTLLIIAKIIYHK